MSVITLPLQSVFNLMSTARFWEKLPLELSEKENKQRSKLWELKNLSLKAVRLGWFWVLLPFSSFFSHPGKFI